MKKTILIMKNEIITLFSSFSFWFGIFGLPLIGFIIYAGVGYLNSTQGGNNLPTPVQQVGQAFTEQKDNRPQAIVDLGGWIKAYPDGFPKNEWKVYASESEAGVALNQGAISTYYVIPADYLKKGQIDAYMLHYRLADNSDRAGQLEWLISYNLLGGNADLSRSVSNPMKKLNTTSIAPPEAGPQRDTSNMWTFFIPYGVMMLFYIGILGSAGLLLNSVSKEKENRTMEVLLLSARPHEMLLGKVLGLGLVGLLQIVMWAGSGWIILYLSGKTFNLPAGAQLPPTLLIWGIIFFLLGYLLYASLMAGLGALVPNLREASQATMVVIFPLMIPLFLISALIDDPQGPLAVALSLFPLTAPTTMMLRMSAVKVPLWQPLLAIGLLIITGFFVVRAVANMFRAQTLLSGQAFHVKRFFLALVGRL